MQLAGSIDSWAATMFVERFFQEAEGRLENVDSERRAELQKRLAFARAMLGTLGALDFFANWRAPEERHKSKFGQY